VVSANGFWATAGSFMAMANMPVLLSYLAESSHSSAPIGPSGGNHLTGFTQGANFSPMKNKKRGLFAEVRAESPNQLNCEDGLEPGEVAKRRRREKQVERLGQAHGFHKQEQFLTQVKSALEAALQSAASPLLNSLLVEEVVQQGGSLLVVVLLPETAQPSDVVPTNRELEQAAPMLRREVAAEITRKETPNLGFVVLPPEAQRLED